MLCELILLFNTLWPKWNGLATSITLGYLLGH